MRRAVFSTVSPSLRCCESTGRGAEETLPGRSAVQPEEGFVTLPGEPITSVFVQRPRPFTAHFPSPRSFRKTQRLGTQTFSELEPPVPAPFCVWRKRPLWRLEVDGDHPWEGGVSYPRSPLCRPLIPPPRSACGEAGAARDPGRGRGVGREAG